MEFPVTPNSLEFPKLGLKFLDDFLIGVPHKLFQQLTQTCNNKKTYPTTTHNSLDMIQILTFPKILGDGSQFFE
jgi:hypothetical protein